MNDDQWLQTYLPVRNGRLVIRSTSKLASTAFFAFGSSTRSLSPGCNSHYSSTPLSNLSRSITNQLNGHLEISVSLGTRCYRASDSPTWLTFDARNKLLVIVVTLRHVQKACDGLIVSKIQAEILGRASDINDKARLLAATSLQSENWLHAPSISSNGLRLANKMIRICWPETRSQNLRTTYLPLSEDGRPQRITWPFLSQKYSQTAKACTDQGHISPSNPTDTDFIKQRSSLTPMQWW